MQDKPADVVGEIQIELNDYCCRRKAVEIFAEIREKTASFPGITVEIRKIEGGPPTGKDVRLEVKSTSYDEMVATIARTRAFVDTMENVQEIEDGRPLPGIEWELEVDRELAGRYGAGITSIGAMVQLVTNGVKIGTYRPDDSEDELDIPVRLPKEQRTFDTLDNLKVQTSEGQVPLANFVTRTPKQVVGSITRKDGLYAMEVKANLGDAFKADGGTIQTKIDEIQTWLDAEEWPSSVQFRFRGSDEEQAAAGEFLGKAAAISLFIMFIILVTQFNSFYQAILTLSTVVLAVLGVLIGLMLTGQKFSIIMTGTGVVALAGIVVNNAIILIDTFNKLRSEGVETREAVLENFRPTATAHHADDHHDDPRPHSHGHASEHELLRTDHRLRGHHFRVVGAALHGHHFGAGILHHSYVGGDAVHARPARQLRRCRRVDRASVRVRPPDTGVKTTSRKPAHTCRWTI